MQRNSTKSNGTTRNSAEQHETSHYFYLIQQHKNELDETKYEFERKEPKQNKILTKRDGTIRN